jgi:hypothetical protein
MTHLHACQGGIVEGPPVWILDPCIGFVLSVHQYISYLIAGTGLPISKKIVIH